MSAWSKILSAEERSEVQSAVVDAYTDENGSTRSHKEAGDRFIQFVHDARQAQRQWADLLWEEWAEGAARNFAKGQWSRRDGFAATVHGKVREKRLNRGVRRSDGEGRVRWTTDSVLTWTLAEIDQNILDEVQRRSEAQYNLGWMGPVRRLMSQSGAETVRGALDAIGMTLEEYLAQEDAA